MELGDKTEHERPAKQAVVLVHGLWMKGWVLALQKRRFAARGYHAYLFSYPTMKASLAQNADRLAAFIASLPVPHIHLIGHSLGGLLILEALKKSPDPRICGIVLLGPPYADCQSARVFGRKRIGRWLLGKALPQWLDSEKMAWRGEVPLGVIAGSRRFGLGMFFTRFAGVNDGVVALEETRIPGMSAHIVLPIAHSEMIISSKVVDAACRFLKEGRFLGEG